MIRVTVDIVILALGKDCLKVLLVKRGINPFKNRWAIPGGFVKDDESLPEAAARELREETGLSNLYLEQLFTFGDVARDPRGRIISVAYFAILPELPLPQAGSDAGEAAWYELTHLPDLAFDHKEILSHALRRVRGKLAYSAIGFKFLPEKFTLTELQRAHEVVLDTQMDKRNFRRKIASLAILEPLNEWKKEALARPARYYRFSEAKFERLKRKNAFFS